MAKGESIGRLRRLTDRLRQPEYTGADRCLPCTVVNVVLAVFGAAVLSMFGPHVAIAFLVFSGAVIYFRGYLVPKTPTLTQRYLPERVLALFDHHPADDANEWTGDGDEIDLEAILRHADVVTDDGDDLQLTTAFAREWYRRIERLDEQDIDRAALAPVLGVEVEELSFEQHGDAFVAWFGDHRGGQWESRGAFLADIAAGKLLAARSPDWAALSVAQRSAVLAGLRLFLDRCPVCAGPATFGTDSVESCCRAYDVVAVSCEECGIRLFEERYDNVVG